MTNVESFAPATDFNYSQVTLELVYSTYLLVWPLLMSFLCELFVCVVSLLIFLLVMICSE